MSDHSRVSLLTFRGLCGDKMIKGIHFLLTYKCTSECDHCFLYCSPGSEGTFSVDQLKAVLNEALGIKTLEWIYFEGGEPFMYYPILLEGVKLARSLGYRVGIVTNAYFATGENDTMLWLKPLAELGIDDFSVSDDLFHYSGEAEFSPARVAFNAAVKLGMSAETICIENPPTGDSACITVEQEEPVGRGSVMIRDRAAEKLASQLPGRPAASFDCCPYEDLVHPKRVHLDSFGHVHICQGISIGNMWREPITSILDRFDPAAHPVCGPLAKGGPALLAKTYDISHDAQYADACHFCYSLRLSLLDRFPEYLTPWQVYGR